MKNKGKNNPMFGKNKYNITKQMLIKEYIINKKSSVQIAKKLGCNSETVLNYLKKYKILIRSNSEAQKLINRKGKNNAQFIDGRKKMKHYCIELGCNNEISYGAWKRKNGNCRCHSCATKEEHRIGILNSKNENNPNWQDGIGKLPYSFEFSEALKEEIRKRDNHKCQLCKVYQKDYYRKLDVHHIDYDKQNCNEENLISLCNKCNIKVNYNRDYYYAYFMYITNADNIIEIK